MTTHQVGGQVHHRAGLAVKKGVRALRVGQCPQGERRQGPAESRQASVLGAQSVQAVLHQLAKRLRQALQALLQLRHRQTGGKVPQVFTGQVEVERTHCSLLHYQRLELDGLKERGGELLSKAAWCTEAGCGPCDV
ncbi:hypothetical protein EYF80_034984 [Liparis tanakae]|uniref:Uncharacterized protein n=1 Tax=Liparis tanakae TaxID=230148 RepID=A0A4Z2GMC5_9TELE|nr:hypothetical protein EYF80_034984 [Liparis tanakae]